MYITYTKFYIGDPALMWMHVHLKKIEIVFSENMSFLVIVTLLYWGSNNVCKQDMIGIDQVQD